MDKPSQESLEIAAQCWTDPETENRIMDVELAVAFAKRLDAAKANNERITALSGDGISDSGFKVTITLPGAIKTLVKELKEDENYYYSWQANIAMAFVDEFRRATSNETIDYKQLHAIANKAARNFLTTLIKDVTK